MELWAAGLAEQPFPSHGKPLATISYASKQAGVNVFRDTCNTDTGLSLIQGPPLSGKSTIIRTFVATLHDDIAVAVVDGTGLNTTNFLISVLRQFGFDVELNSTNELMGLVRVFALQQAASHEPPLLVIKNAHELNPSALRALCELATLRVRTCCALKMVLLSTRSLSAIMAAPAMEPIAKRILHDFHLHPMTREEAENYLYAKLRAAGSTYPESVFSVEVCAELWKASAGWPGIIDRLALLALAQAKALPVAVDEIEHPAVPLGTWSEEPLPETEHEIVIPPRPPQLIVTSNGNVTDELTMDKARMLVGRSEHNDISIGSRFISRHHAMFVRHGTATFLMDLNSTNGTFVNSKRISNHVLIHGDVITLGHHRIKFHDPYASASGQLDGAQFADTAIMKTLQDMRSLLAQENTELLPASSEDSPTIQT